MQTTINGYRLIPPLSTPGIGRQYYEALPEATADLCGARGVCIAVGFSVHYTVYRGTFDQRDGTGSWAFLYSWSDKC
jgi:hypothetical protein